MKVMLRNLWSASDCLSAGMPIACHAATQSFGFRAMPSQSRFSTSPKRASTRAPSTLTGSSVSSPTRTYRGSSPARSVGGGLAGGASSTWAAAGGGWAALAFWRGACGVGALSLVAAPGCLLGTPPVPAPPTGGDPVLAGTRTPSRWARSTILLFKAFRKWLMVSIWKVIPTASASRTTCRTLLPLDEASMAATNSPTDPGPSATPATDTSSTTAAGEGLFGGN
mmetsp:Transcript_60444/g.129648  ORF Transcript_60444/g.129648 Transcript_60444/m.129648 type:complete len:224 (+) Transcript_60444:589-1260(+)